MRVLQDSITIQGTWEKMRWWIAKWAIDRLNRVARHGIWCNVRILNVCMAVGLRFSEFSIGTMVFLFDQSIKCWSETQLVIFKNYLHYACAFLNFDGALALFLHLNVFMFCFFICNFNVCINQRIVWLAITIFF